MAGKQKSYILNCFRYGFVGHVDGEIVSLEQELSASVNMHLQQFLVLSVQSVRARSAAMSVGTTVNGSNLLFNY